MAELTRISAKDTFPGRGTLGNTAKFLDDINIAYSDPSNQLKVYDTDAIDNMIENVIMTIKGSREFEPEFGSEIPSLLWEPCDDTTAYYIETELFVSVGRWVPYIRIDYANTKVTPYLDQQLFEVYMPYVILIGGTRGSLRLKLIQ